MGPTNQKFVDVTCADELDGQNTKWNVICWATSSRQDDYLDDGDYSPDKISSSEEDDAAQNERILGEEESGQENTANASDDSDEEGPLPAAASRKKEGRGTTDNRWRTRMEYNSNWPTQIPFTGQPGVKANITTETKPIDHVSLVFDDDLLNTVVVEKNRRANEVMNTTRTATLSKKEIQWKDITLTELKTFLGLCCLSGTVRFPILAKQWSKDILYNHHLSGNVVWRNRFSLILRMLQFVNHNNVDGEDKLLKIRPILDKVVESVQNVYYPTKELSIDKAMIQWRGRSVYTKQIPF